jgi:hypothetical protein
MAIMDVSALVVPREPEGLEVEAEEVWVYGFQFLNQL